MGYSQTYYINPKINQSTLFSVIEDLTIIVKDGFSKGILGLPDGSKSKNVESLISQDFIAFNGIGDNAVESFSFALNNQLSEFYRGESLSHTKGFLYNSTKTYKKDYDLYVLMCLCVLKKHLKSDIKIKSDGGSVAIAYGQKKMNLLLNKELVKRKLVNL